MEKINKLKNLLKEYNLDGYIIPKNDEFFNEYIPENKEDENPVVFVHGSFGGHFMWNKIAVVLAENGFHSLQPMLFNGIAAVQMVRHGMKENLENSFLSHY
jgi:dienelactone hydrolase